MSGKKISFDFHGVINKAPELFKALSDLATEAGYEVYVVSGGPREYIEEYLAQHQIKYDNLWCIFDYFDAKEKIAVAADGSFHIDDLAWDAAKGKYCAQKKICLHIDDSQIYGRYFTTPYVRFDEKTNLLHYEAQSTSILKGAENVWAKLQEWCC